MRRLVHLAIAVVVALVLLQLVWRIYAAGQPVLAAAVLGFFALGLFVYTVGRAYNWRYLFPGLAGMAIFVIFPLVYTVRIGFTNYSSAHLQTFDGATRYLLSLSEPSGEAAPLDMSVLKDGDKLRLLLTTRPPEPAAEGDDDAAGADSTDDADAPPAKQPAKPPAKAEAAAPAGPVSFLTEPFELGAEVNVKATQVAAGAPTGEALGLGELIPRREALRKVDVELPDGSHVKPTGLREAGAVQPTWKKNDDGSLTNTKTKVVIRPNMKTGYYETDTGEFVRPGFAVDVGLGNYHRMTSDPEFRGPFLSIFGWTLVFAGLTVVFTVCVGMTLAVVLNWEALRFRGLYRMLLFLPYAVPGFISILVFRGLFNQNFGEVNFILGKLFGIRPQWFADPFTAKCMILIVNTWLGYPYILVLCLGLIKAIPFDLYEASALEGASALTNFFKITAPLILRPLTPLLIASFGFNFNNYALINLLTRGRPDFLGTRVPAGTTDILVTYLNRIAFEDSGQQFGLAAAISTVIFILIAALSYLNMKLTRADALEEGRA